MTNPLLTLPDRPILQLRIESALTQPRPAGAAGAKRLRDARPFAHDLREARTQNRPNESKRTDRAAGKEVAAGKADKPPIAEGPDNDDHADHAADADDAARSAQADQSDDVQTTASGDDAHGRAEASRAEAAAVDPNATYIAPEDAAVLLTHGAESAVEADGEAVGRDGAGPAAVTEATGNVLPVSVARTPNVDTTSTHAETSNAAQNGAASVFGAVAQNAAIDGNSADVTADGDGSSSSATQSQVKEAKTQAGERAAGTDQTAAAQEAQPESPQIRDQPARASQAPLAAEQLQRDVQAAEQLRSQSQSTSAAAEQQQAQSQQAQFSNQQHANGESLGEDAPRPRTSELFQQQANASSNTETADVASRRAEQMNLSLRAEQAAAQHRADGSLVHTNTASPQLETASHTPVTGRLGGAAATPFGERGIFTAGADSAEESANAQRMVRGMSAVIRQGGGALTMRLDPPELGVLRVQMTIAKGVVTANFEASSQQARAVIEQNLSSLRTALESQGLQVERLHVHTASSQHGTSNHAGSDSNAHHQQGGERSSHDAGQGESRGRNGSHDSDDARGDRSQDQQHERNQRSRSFSSWFTRNASGTSFADAPAKGGAA